MRQVLRAALALIATVAAGLAVASGGSGADPRTPAALPGLPAPFLGTAVAGSGGLAAAVDAYGAVVEMRAPGPAGAALIDNPAARQAAGSVSPDTGIVPRIEVGRGRALPIWKADSVAQRYEPGADVVRTVASFRLGGAGRPAVRVEMTDAARGQRLAETIRVDGPAGVRLAPQVSIAVEEAGCAVQRRGRVLGLVCSPRDGAGPRGARRSLGAGALHPDLIDEARRVIVAAATADRRWLARARPLGAAAPAWARRMYRRSLLTLRALTDARSGAVAAGIRDGWAYVWPRDAATAAIALATAGYRAEARRVSGFLDRLDLGAAARFGGDGAAVPGRAAQGDPAGWVAAAARATGLRSGRRPAPAQWRDRADYQEGGPGEYLGNAIASGAGGSLGAFATPRGLVRRAGDPGSGLDSAAAWAVRPFPHLTLYPQVRRTLLRLAAHGSRFGIAPGEAWPDPDSWSAPTAWSAWSLAALGERGAALRLLGDLRRAATPAGALPERVGARTGIPASTTPLAWSHAFAILALRQLWPRPKGGV